MSDVSKSLAEKLGLEYIESLGEVSPPQDLEMGEFNKIIGTWAKQNKVIPLKVEDGNIVIAVSDPLNTEISDVLSLVYGMPTLRVVAPEEEILNAINDISAEKTCLMIAHRLSTIANADKIIVLEKGNIVEQGSHTELLNLNKRYAELWRLQESEA